MAAQAFQAWVLQKKWPAGEAGINAAFKPRKRSLSLIERGKNTGDLIERVVGVTERFRVRTCPADAPQRLLGFAQRSMHHTLKGDDHWFFLRQASGFTEQALSLFPFAGQDREVQRKMDGILIRGIIGAPLLYLIECKFVFTAPEIDLGDTVADRFCRIERPAPLKHRTRVIEQTDMRQDRPETAVGMREILLKRERTLQFGNRLDMLEVLRGSPKEKRLGHVSFGQSRIQFQSALTVKFGLLQPTPAGIDLEVKLCTDKRKSRMGERKHRIASHRVHHVSRSFLDRK